MRAYEFLKNKVKITVFDIPGLADTKGNDEERSQRKILFCTEMSGTRFCKDDLETMEKLSICGCHKFKDCIYSSLVSISYQTQDELYKDIGRVRMI